MGWHQNLYQKSSSQERDFPIRADGGKEWNSTLPFLPLDFFYCNRYRRARVVTFFADIGDMWQQLPHFLRTSVTCGNSFRIFCGHRRHVATASAFFADIGDTWQQLPHFLRTSVTRGNSFRIFCGHRRHVATASAFFADIVDTWQQLPHFLRTSSTCGNSSRIFCGNRPRMSTITCKMENFYFTQPIG